MSAPLVVGLDLSITATGICNRLGNCFTEGGKADLGDHRLWLIREKVRSNVVVMGATEKVDVVVIEGLAQGRQGGNGLAAAQVLGAVKVLLVDEAVPYVLVPPATLKKFATGKGNADKTAMAMAAYKRAGVEFADDNQCDAFWLRAAGLHALGHPLFDLPAAQTAALDKVAWPTHLLREDTP